MNNKDGNIKQECCDSKRVTLKCCKTKINKIFYPLNKTKLENINNYLIVFDNNEKLHCSGNDELLDVHNKLRLVKNLNEDCGKIKFVSFKPEQWRLDAKQTIKDTIGFGMFCQNFVRIKKIIYVGNSTTDYFDIKLEKYMPIMFVNGIAIKINN